MARSSLIRPTLSALTALPVALAFAAGILAQTVMPSGSAASVTFAFVGAASVAGLFFAPTRRSALLGIIALAGAADSILSRRLDTTGPVPAGEHDFTAVIYRRYPADALALRLTAVDDLTLSRGLEVMAVVRGEVPSDAVSGYSIRFHGALTPRYTADDGLMPDYGHRFAATCYLPASYIIAVTPAPGLLAAADRCRSRLSALIMASALSSRSKEFLVTALLGEKSAISQSSRETFARAGLAHILALSGLHLAIIAGLFYWLLAPLVLIGPRHLRSVTLIILIWAYTLLTGMGAPVVRAAVMTSIVLLGDLLQRRPVALNSLFAAALIILIFSPESISDAGFQLTFLSVGAIITLSGPLNPFAASPRPILFKAGEAIGVSTAAMLAAGLIAAIRFHSFPLLFLPANILLTPVIIPLLLGAGLALLAALVLGLPCGILISVVNLLVGILDGVARAIASIPFAAIPTYGLSTLTVILTLAVIVAAALSLWPAKPPRFALLSTALLSVAAIISASVTDDISPAPAPGGYIIPGRMRHAAILIPSGSRLYLVTDAPPTIALNLRSRLETDLADFMGSRRLTSVTLLPDTFTADGIIRRGGHIISHGKYLRIISRPEPPVTESLPRPDIAVIVPGFRGDPAYVTDSVRPRRAVVSAQLNSRVRNRLTDSLTARGIPYEIK